MIYHHLLEHKKLSSIQQPDLIKKFMASGHRNHRPLLATFELTYRCNLQCIHCYITDDDPYREEMSVESWIQAIRELKELGAIYITLTGGEPTLYPGFWRILEELYRNNFIIRVFTNGTTLNTDGIDKLIRYGVRFVDISLHGPELETHEAITRTPGSFQKTINTINMLKSAGIHYNLKANMLKPNYKTVNMLHRCMLALGGMPMLTPILTPDNHGGSGPVEHEVGETELCYLFDKYYSTDFLDEESNTYRDRIQIVMRCAAGFSSLSIAPNGEVLPCLQARISMGNLRRQALRRIWFHSPVYLYLKTLLSLRPPDCTDCALKRFCARCPGLAYIEQGSLWKASPTACKNARKMQAAFNHVVSQKGIKDEEKIHSS